MLGLETALRLSQSFDVERLQQDLDAIKHISMAAHPDVEYHNGSWSGIALVNAEGKLDLSYQPDESRSKAKYQKTEILNHCPYLNEIIDSFPCQKNRVRLLSLERRGIILEHVDEGVSVDGHLIRFHIPIVTHSQVFFFLGMERCLWQPGELWYGDFSFPHHIKNLSPITRVHMVIDFPVNNESLKLLPSEYVKQKKWRKINRKLQQKLCKTKRNLLEMTKGT
jgi:hypothetical protein